MAAAMNILLKVEDSTEKGHMNQTYQGQCSTKDMSLLIQPMEEMPQTPGNELTHEVYTQSQRTHEVYTQSESSQ